MSPRAWGERRRVDGRARRDLHVDMAGALILYALVSCGHEVWHSVGRRLVLERY